MIHVGVSSSATQLTLEKYANRIGYKKPDCSGKCHSTGMACCDSDDRIETEIDVGAICESINLLKGVKSCGSDDAGRCVNIKNIYFNLI